MPPALAPSDEPFSDVMPLTIVVPVALFVTFIVLLLPFRIVNIWPLVGLVGNAMVIDTLPVGVNISNEVVLFAVTVEPLVGVTSCIAWSQ